MDQCRREYRQALESKAMVVNDASLSLNSRNILDTKRRFSDWVEHSLTPPAEWELELEFRLQLRPRDTPRLAQRGQRVG